MLGVLLTAGGLLLGVWATFKYVIFVEMRLDANTYKTLYEVCKSERRLLIREEFVSDHKPPIIFVSLCMFRGVPWFYINHGERLLTAGWTGKDTVTTVTCFRWSVRRLKAYFKTKLKELQLDRLGVPVELITPNYTDRVGVLKKMGRTPIHPPAVWSDIDAEVAEVLEGRRDKTSALLYGPPGNGKSSFVKYLATKYRVPIKVITFDSHFNNHDLMSIFSQITPRCLVLLEDFDNYFNGRECILGSGNTGIRFTFDIILNGLDGVYNTYENVVFVMTVNDIDKVDHALKNRPSRLKYVRKFDNPGPELRAELLPPGWSGLTAGLNLDQIMRLAEFAAEGFDLKAALAKMEKELDQSAVRALAYQKYEERVAGGVEGSPEGDWEFARRKLGYNPEGV